MSKATRMPPNDMLRSERLRRGWSREYVATQIGVADPKTIGRWERGDAMPSAYFRQKLCAFFERSAQELGLYREEAHQAITRRQGAAGGNGQALPSEEAEPLSPSRLYDPAIPAPVADSPYLIGRDELVTTLKEQLCQTQVYRRAALYGLPGVGKTALALALVHHPQLQEEFSGGVLWGSLGPEPDLPGLLQRWAALLEIPAHVQIRLRSLEGWIQAIRGAIGQRRMLLVLDDAWSCSEARLLTVGGPHCAYLLTTRLPAVALYFAGEQALQVPQLNESQALSLLERFAPLAVRQERETVRRLAQTAAGLPLALTLMGRYLQSQSYSGQPRRLHAALERLQCPGERLHLTGSSVRTGERQCSQSQLATPLSLATTLETSYRYLSNAARQTLVTLATLPLCPHSFSEADVADMIAVETLDELTDAGLLESAGAGCYSLHPVIADYARTLVREKAAAHAAETAHSLRSANGQTRLDAVLYHLEEIPYLKQGSTRPSEEERARADPVMLSS